MSLYDNSGRPAGRWFQRGVSGDDAFIGRDKALAIAKGGRVTSDTQLLAFVEACFAKAGKPFTEEDQAQWAARWNGWETSRDKLLQQPSPSPSPQEGDQDDADGQQPTQWAPLTGEELSVRLRIPAVTLLFRVPLRLGRALVTVALILVTAAGVINYFGFWDDGDSGDQGHSTTGVTPSPSTATTTSPSPAHNAPGAEGSHTAAPEDTRLHLSAASGRQHALVTLTASGFEPQEQVRFEIFEGACRVPFPEDDHPVLRDINADSGGAITAELRLYTDVDCAGGPVEVRATGRHSKVTRSADFTFK